MLKANLKIVWDENTVFWQNYFFIRKNSNAHFQYIDNKCA